MIAKATSLLFLRAGCFVVGLQALACALGCSGTHARADGGDASAAGADAACGDTMFDPNNCGACGHDCDGGACQNGACVSLGPGVLATGQGQPGALVVDDANVYWANADPPAILACAKAGCGNAPTVLAQGQWGAAQNLALVGKDLYWGGGHVVYHCATGGCGGKADAFPVSDNVGQVVADPSGGNLYFTESGGVRECSPSDCDGGIAVSWGADAGPAIPVDFVDGGVTVLALAIDRSDLYILGQQGSIEDVAQCSLASCVATVCPVVSALGPPLSPMLPVDSTQFYLVQATDGGFNGAASVSAVVKPDGGQAGGLLVRGGLSTLISGLSAPSALAVDDQAVYVADLGDTNEAGARPVGAGSIGKCPSSGCGGVAETVQDYLNGPSGIAIDATNIYWTERSASGEPSGPPSGRVAFRAK